MPAPTIETVTEETSRPKVLFVDDEPNILSSLQRLLRKESIQFRCTSSPHEAIKWIEEESFAVIVSDHRMPEMVGTVLLEKIKEISPDTVRIILTGYADMSATLDAINKGSVYRFLAKPWNEQEMVLTLRQAVAQHSLVQENARLQKLTHNQNLELKDLNLSLEQKVEERTAEVLKLHGELEKSFLAAVRALAGFTEMTSPHLGGHSRRVAARCKAMAKLLGLSGGDSVQLEVAALVHDIGELVIPAEILRKPTASLKGTELHQWQAHVFKGEGVLRMVPHFEKAAQMVRHHHEHFNGTGFPNGLKGEAIPIGSRIIAVVDAYENMLYRRMSQPVSNPESALDWLKNQGSADFDPTIVEAFSKYLKNEIDKKSTDEIQLTMSELREGMILSRDIRNHLGALLLPAGTALSQEQLARMMNFQVTDQVEVGDIFIKRPVPPAEKAA